MSKLRTNSVLKEFQGEDAALAEQLLSLRQPPPPNLQRRVQAIPQKSRGKHRFKIPRMVWGVAALVVVLMLVVSPGARARLGELRQVVGQINLGVTDVEPTFTNPVAVDSVAVSLDEAQMLVPFNVALPAFVPGDLVASNAEISILKIQTPIVKMLWAVNRSDFVQLSLRSNERDAPLSRTLVGPYSSQTVLINGQEAALVRGGWNKAEQSWDYQDQLTTLIWHNNGVQYKILSVGNQIPLAELIAMAESIQ